MGIYDNVGVKRKHKSVRLTPHQEEKLTHIIELFGISEQRFWTDCLDFFYMEMLDVQSGRVNISTAVKTSMLNLIDDYIKLREIKGLTKRPFVLRKR